VGPSEGAAVFNSTAYGSGLTDEIRSYPQDSLAAPLSENEVEFSLAVGQLPAGATQLMTREGTAATPSRDRLSDLISAPQLTLPVALLGLLLATLLGAVHALSPGHGKTVVGAYLVGSRGTARHAAFLGLTVTVTHTIGVFGLGLVTLAASRYILPERLFPVMSIISGLIVLSIGASLFVKRLRTARTRSASRDHEHSHDHGHSHDTDHTSLHSHDPGHFEDHSHVHSHSPGAKRHSHLPPGADGTSVTWRSLLALGISGGLLPCPSALVVLLNAISLHRVAYGLLLVLAFSIGLAATLTAVGLLFVFAGRIIKRHVTSSRLVRILPVVSALVITCAGAAICYEAMAGAGLSMKVILAALRFIVTST
jgi:ABC-type nickel/cobalt efflux system permease component RcnA